MDPNTGSDTCKRYGMAFLDSTGHQVDPCKNVVKLSMPFEHHYSLHMIHHHLERYQRRFHKSHSSFMNVIFHSLLHFRTNYPSFFLIISFICTANTGIGSRKIRSLLLILNSEASCFMRSLLPFLPLHHPSCSL